MKIPRDISGGELVKLLKIYGYSISRQSGSHMRLTTLQNGEHHITIPNHAPIKIGTLAAILGEVALHFRREREDIMKELFS